MDRRFCVLCGARVARKNNPTDRDLCVAHLLMARELDEAVWHQMATGESLPLDHTPWGVPIYQEPEAAP